MQLFAYKEQLFVPTTALRALSQSIKDYAQGCTEKKLLYYPSIIVSSVIECGEIEDEGSHQSAFCKISESVFVDAGLATALPAFIRVTR
jgi:hypothetical protein